MTQNDIATISEQAVERIRTRGWVKGHVAPLGDGGPMCLAGTFVHLAIGTMPILKEAAQIIREQFPGRLPMVMPDDSMYTITHFNDHPDTTEDDVIAVLEKLGTKEGSI